MNTRVATNTRVSGLRPAGLKGKITRKDPSVVVIHIRVSGIVIDQDALKSIRQRVDRRFRKFASSIERVSVRLRDVNGPRGGVDKACRLKIVLKDLPSVVFETKAVSLDAAVANSVGGAERAVRRSVQRRRSKPIKRHARTAHVRVA